MRVAVLADIHGNLVALEAVLDLLPRLRVEQIVVAGDIVNGSPDSRACCERVESLRCPVLRGNHERYVYDFGTDRARPEWSTRQFAPVQFTRQQLGASYCEWLAHLPLVWRDELCPDLLFVHASPRNDHDHVFPYTVESEIEAMMQGVGERWMVRGHNHYAGVHLWRGGQIVNTGSVGLPLDGTAKAQFVILERRTQGWRVEHHAVPYDVARASSRFVETGYLEAAGPLAHLYRREVETASFHIIPFLKFQTAYLAREKGADLDAAWQAYLKKGY